MSRLTLLPLVLILSSCNLGFDEGFDDDRDVEDLPATLESVQNEIFTPYCEDCHGSETAHLGLELDTEQNSYDHLVDKKAKQREGNFLLVDPGEPEQSYLIFKVEGYDGVIDGDRMPPSGAKLSEPRIQLLRDWITNGAPRTGTGNSPAKVSEQKALNTASDTITFSLHFSRPIDEETLTPETILVYAEVEGEYQLLDREQYTLAQIDDQNVEIDVVFEDLNATAIKLVINDPSIASVMDENGYLLDGDNDNAAGGAFEYIYKITNL